MFSKIKGNGGFIGRVEINQFGAAFLGVTLSIVTVSLNDWLFLAASVGAVIFYLSLLYTAFWDFAAKEAIRIEGGRSTYQPLAGLGLSLVANIPNILLGLVIFVLSFFAEKTEVGGVLVANTPGAIYDVVKVIAQVWEAMYWGILYIVHYPALLYLVIVLPALAVSALGYYAGLKNFKLLEYLHLSSGDKKKKPETRI